METAPQSHRAGASANANARGDATRPAAPRDLQGRIVLVKSSRDRRNPPAAMRGSLEVREFAKGEPEVSIGVEFPQMFATSAHHRVIPLDRPALARLLASEKDGVFEFTIDDELR